jgi:type II secretory pathway component GspD/PulD (secretin)
MKYKGLKFLMVSAFVFVCAVAAAENGIKDSNLSGEASAKSDEASTGVTVPDMNSTTNKDSNSALRNTLHSTEQEDFLVTLDQRMKKTISVDFINTPIEDVIKMIAEQADVDIIKSPTVTGNVTAKLTNVPLGEALDNILAIHGYGRVINKNVIRVSPLDEIAQKEEILDTRVYQITYADIGDVESALKKFISKRGSISCSPGTSNIIVKDSESNIKAIDSFIEKIDRVTPQVLVEARIYDISSTEGFDIGADWSFGRNTPITSIGDTKTLSRTDTASNPIYTSETTITDTVDTVDPTNTGTVTVTETTISPATTGYEISNETERAIDATKAWQQNTAGGVTGADSYLYRKSKPFVGGDFEALTGGTIRLGLLDTVNVELALNILRSEVGAKLLANPRILVLDNETAEFRIITQIPYTEVSTTGNTATQTVKFKDVGVELKVTPHVTRDGMVRLNITPEFGVRVGSTTPPTIDTRKVNTKALVKDGQTVVLGGLRKREVSQEVHKVAVLGDIPILGGLFSDVQEEVVTSELIIFITPKIFTEPTLSVRERKGLEATEFSGPKITYTRDEKDDNAQK